MKIPWHAPRWSRATAAFCLALFLLEVLNPSSAFVRVGPRVRRPAAHARVGSPASARRMKRLAVTQNRTWTHRASRPRSTPLRSHCHFATPVEKVRVPTPKLLALLLGAGQRDYSLIAPIQLLHPPCRG